MAIDPDHEAARDRKIRKPWFERDIGQKFEGDRPERFRDNPESGIGREMMGELVGTEPPSAAAVRIQKSDGCGFLCSDVVEEATVDEVLREDFFGAEFLGEVVLEKPGKLKLVGAEAGEFFEVVIAGVRAGEGEAVFGFDSEVELGREFEVDELARGEISEEEIELADGGVDVGLNLEIAGEEVELRRGFEEEGEGVFVKVAEFLAEIERGDFGRMGELVMVKGRGFGEVIDEKGALDQASQKGEGRGIGMVRRHEKGAAKM